MECHAKELMQQFCASQDQQNLDDPVIEYLANLLLEFSRGEEECETLLEVMSAYFTKPISPDDLHQLKQSLDEKKDLKITAQQQKQAPLVEGNDQKKEKEKFKLNVDAVEFKPGALHQGEPYSQELVQMDLVEFIDGRLQDPEHDPINLLNSLFPDVEVTELERLYRENDESFVWTWEALLMEKGGFETVSAGRKGQNCETEVPVPQPPKYLDLGEEEFPELPGQRPVATMNPSGNAKTMYLDMAKKKQPPTSTGRPNANGAPDSCQTIWRDRNENGESIPWVVTGDAVSKQYKELRAAAVEYAKMRNACFSEATKAFFSGDKALARELGTKGRNYCEEMKRCHHDASEAIFKHRNDQLKRMMSSTSPEAVDLHGLHVAEARRILGRELKERSKQKTRGRNKVIHLIVGTGHHTKGARTPSRLPPAVQNFLTEEGYTYRLTRPGVIEVDI